MKTTACGLLALLLMGVQLLAAGKVIDSVPEAKELGANWRREQHLLIEDLKAPPKFPATPEGKDAAEAFALMAPLLEARKVAGAGNWFFQTSDGGKDAVYDTYIYCFANEADALAFWEKSPARKSEPYAVGEQGQFAAGAGVLTFRRKNFYVKITLIGADTGLGPLARAIDARLSR